MYADSMSSAAIKSECKVYYNPTRAVCPWENGSENPCRKSRPCIRSETNGLRLRPQPQQNGDGDIPCLKKYGIEHGYKK